MSWSIAELWEEQRAKDIAREIGNHDNIRTLYCGPAVVVWIAAVWNLNRGRSYNYMSRLADKNLFPDGPRDFTTTGSVPGFQNSLEAILKRETDKELHLSNDTYYRYGSIHDQLERHDMPIIIRFKGSGFTDGLHYVTLYKSEKDRRAWRPDRIQFYWQDNGTYGKRDIGNPGLYKSEWRTIGLSGSFKFGAKRVVRN